jgi:hypothetical protein
MQREPSFKPVNSRPTQRTNLLPIVVGGGLAFIVICAAAFALFAFFWQPDVPDDQSQPTPAGAVVNYVTPTPTAQGAEPPTPTPLPPAPQDTPVVAGG